MKWLDKGQKRLLYRSLMLGKSYLKKIPSQLGMDERTKFKLPSYSAKNRPVSVKK